MKIIMIILIAMFLISFVSPLNVSDVKAFWQSRGMSETESNEMSSGIPSQQTQAKAQSIQTAEQEIGKINQTELLEIELEEDKRKDGVGLFFLGVLGLMGFGFIMFVIYKFVAWGQ